MFITVRVRIKRILGRDRKDWKFEKAMDTVYGYKRSVRPVVTISSTGEGDTVYSSLGDISNGDQIEKSDLTSASPSPSPGTSASVHEDDADSDIGPPSKKSRRLAPPHKYATTKESFMKMMDSCQRARARQHEQKLDLLARLHQEKMEMFGGLLDAIKGLSKQ